MPKTIVLYRWTVFDEVRGRWLDTRYSATEADMLVRHPEARRLDATREEREVPEDPNALSTSAFLRNPEKKPPMA